MKTLKPVSRWIAINYKDVTPKSELYQYGGDDLENGKRCVAFFRFNNKEWAFDRFLSRYGMLGFDYNCEEYPAYITSYDGDNYYNPLYCRIDEYGEKIRLYEEI